MAFRILTCFLILVALFNGLYPHDPVLPWEMTAETSVSTITARSSSRRFVSETGGALRLNERETEYIDRDQPSIHADFHMERHLVMLLPTVVPDQFLPLPLKIPPTVDRVGSLNMRI